MSLWSGAVRVLKLPPNCIQRNTWNPAPGSGNIAGGIKNSTMLIAKTAIAVTAKIILCWLFNGICPLLFKNAFPYFYRRVALVNAVRLQVSRGYRTAAQYSVGANSKAHIYDGARTNPCAILYHDGAGH